MEAEIEKIIRAYFDEAAGSKLEEGDRGLLFDPDSNWGFSPTELARQIATIPASEAVTDEALFDMCQTGPEALVDRVRAKLGYHYGISDVQIVEVIRAAGPAARG